MRALKAATIIMGILILVGTAVLVAAIIKRSTAPAPAPESAALVPSAAPFDVTLRAPAGSRILGVAAAGPYLAVAVGGAGQEEVVMLDPRTGQRAGTVTLAAP